MNTKHTQIRFLQLAYCLVPIIIHDVIKDIKEKRLCCLVEHSLYYTTCNTLHPRLTLNTIQTQSLRYNYES